MLSGLIGLPVLGGVFVLAMVLGAVSSKTHFCTMGGVSDWLNIRDTGRLGAWFMAIAVAMLGVTLLEAAGVLSLAATRPPYRETGFALIRYLLGGFAFGIGMVLASGCPTKNLVRLGNGSGQALVALLAIAGGAWLMTRTNFYALVFHSWLQYLTVDFSRYGIPDQDLGSLLAAAGGFDAQRLRLLLGLALALLIALVVARSADFRARGDNLLSGLVVGLCVIGGWYLSGGPWGQSWQDAAQWLDQPPAGVGVQSFTFVNPLGEMLTYIGAGAPARLLTFGIVAVAGVVTGAFGHSIVARRFRPEWFRSWSDFLRHLIGGALMGIGGVLALGCTIGQGISGTSTLALGSFLALGAMILGAASAMKIQYYKLLYDDASWWDALLSGWVDLHLLPQTWRRLEAL